MFVAAARVPDSFRPSLMPRSSVDQGLVTGLSMASNYALAALVEDALEALALLLSGRLDGRKRHDQAPFRATLALDLASVGVGLALQRAFGERTGESLRRSTLRTAGYWLSSASLAGAAVRLLDEAARRLDRRPAAEDAPRSYPVGLVGGGVLAASLEMSRRRRDRHAGDSRRDESPKLSGAKSLALGIGVSAAVAGLSAGERAFASRLATILARALPAPERLWRPAGHAAALYAMLTGVRLIRHRIYSRIDTAAERLEPAFETPPASPLASGGPGSLVPFETLSKEGRRYVATYLRPDWIEAVMGEPARAEPIRVFVGLDTAPTEEARVKLAMDELERTGAFERSLLMVISPTGTGYVNYVAVESAEYLTRGDVASVALQYSFRPSVLSLDRVWEGRRHFRMLVDAIHDRLRDEPIGGRPRVALFGESLGAWTSQDAFRDQGTKGVVERGIDRALWIGTPYESRWKEQVLRDARADVDPSLIGVFNGFDEVEALDAAARERLRYVMITHDNDAVAHFGADLLVQAPAWLGDPATRPAAVPTAERWTTPTTFWQTFIDLKNAAHVIPGEFEAKGHDYRADLLRFVREVYGLDASEEQMTSVEGALRRYEKLRAEWIAARDKRPEVAHERVRRKAVTGTV